MALPHFFLIDQIVESESQEIFCLRLAPDDIKHARVLRLKAGEHIAIIDSAQDYFECEIISFHNDDLNVRISQKIDVDKPSPLVLLVQGIAKGDKMDNIIRHGTEVGVSGFVPFKSERSIVKFDQKKAVSKTKRWQAIARSAAMQSGRRVIPEVAEPLSLDEVAEFISRASVVIICWEDERAVKLKDAVQTALARQWILPEDARIAVIVGPEGGLTSEEVEHLRSANKYAATVSLGASILRTETAGVVAPALVLYELDAL